MYNPWLDEGFARPGARHSAPWNGGSDFEIAATCHLQVGEQRRGEGLAVLDAMKAVSPSTWAAWAPRTRTSTTRSSSGWATVMAAEVQELYLTARGTPPPR